MEGRPLASTLMYREAAYGMRPMSCSSLGPQTRLWHTAGKISEHVYIGTLVDRQFAADSQCLRDSRCGWVPVQESDLDLPDGMTAEVRGRFNDDESQFCQGIIERGREKADTKRRMELARHYGMLLCHAFFKPVAASDHVPPYFRADVVGLIQQFLDT